MALAVGTRLGAYEVAGALGAGGEVYRARDPRLGRDLAIKALPDHLTDDPSALARFQRVAKVLATLSHPNILTIFDVGSKNGISFVVDPRFDSIHSAPRLEELLAKMNFPQ